jgi:isocitrate/isopropylmalate dehydrogenase
VRPSTSFEIAVLPRDGIGQEVTQPCLDLLAAAIAKEDGVALRPLRLEARARTCRETGTALPQATLAAMGLPDVRYPEGTEIAPHLDLRFEHGLYAEVRPIPVPSRGCHRCSRGRPLRVMQRISPPRPRCGPRPGGRAPSARASHIRHGSRRAG